MSELRTVQPRLIVPDWPSPANVKACFTTRHGGVSKAPWNSLNVASHVGDCAQAVAQNRAILRASVGLISEPCWLDQRHSATVYRVTRTTTAARADAAITRERGLACAVMVADCVPILLCAEDGSEVAAVHAGWRGLANRIIDNTVTAFALPAQRLVAWIGPCIRDDAYVIGADLRAHFLAIDSDWAQFFPRRDATLTMDLRGLARAQLSAAGVQHICASRQCVYSEDDSFFSYRRDGDTGRMAALIWIAD